MCLGHAGVLDHLCIWRQLTFGCLLTLLGLLDELLEGWNELLEHFLGIQRNVAANSRIELVNGRGEGRVIVVADRLAILRLSHVAIRAVEVPQRHVLLDVFDQMVEVVGVRKWRLAKERVQAKLQVILNVCDVVLLHVRIGWLANEHCCVLVRRGALLGRWGVLHQLVDVWHLHLLE